MIDKRDAQNLLTILNRATYTGLDEALAATLLRNKLEAIMNAPDEVPEPVADVEVPEE